MILPRILIIDDQYARDDDERSILKRNAGIVEITSDTSDERLSRLTKADTIAAAVFCSGQKVTKTTVENRYDIIKESVAKGWSNGSKFKWNLILLDVRFDSKPIKDEDDKFGETVRDRLNHDFSGLPLVMFSSKGQSDIEDTETPYLSKEDLGKSEFKKCLLEHGILNVEQSRRLLELDKDVIASSSTILNVFRKARSHAATDDSVLILGESGVGKEKIARYIHQMSSRNSGPFVAINVAAIPDTLLESEFFGVIPNYPGFHNRDGLVGKFELANGGTLFLDEIGDMPLPSQIKVLRALQEKEIVRIGGSEPISVDIRLLSATARDIPQKIAKGEFLKDFLHRVNTLPITIPPLREHTEDIIPLAESLLEECSRQQKKKGITLSAGAKKQLEKYPFANNNVRELENLIKLIMSTTEKNCVISVKDVASALKQLLVAPPEPPVPLPKPEQETRTQTIKAPEPPKTSLKPPSAVPVAPSAEVKESKSTITLQNLADILNTLPIDKDDPALKGAKPRLEEAFQNLMKHLLGAALERCRDPLTKQFNRQSAMRLLTGDENLKGKGPERMLNEILGRNQATPIQDGDLQALIEAWKKHGRSKA